MVIADVIAHACCYYDHANPTTNPDDNYVTIDFGTTGVDNYLQVYTPVGEAESINSQRHSGVWSDEKYRLVTSGPSLMILESNIIIMGLTLNNHKVYQLEEIDEVKGEANKYHLNLTPQQFKKEYNWNGVFTINKEEDEYYEER